MRALSVVPGTRHTLSLLDVPEPAPAPDELLVEAIAMGVCGTDKEIVAGSYGWAPPGEERLVIGHESLGRVREAPESSAFSRGDLVVGVVRRPDPVPCGACDRGEFDMCRNGRYTERGIKESHGYGSEVWSVDQDYAVKLDDRLGDVGMLMEPTTIVAKAWEQIENVGRRAWFEPRNVLVTGAGPIGLLAAMLGVQRGLDVHVLDRVTAGPNQTSSPTLGPRITTMTSPPQCADTSQTSSSRPPGTVLLVFDAFQSTSSYGIVCLTGVSPKGRSLRVDASGINREMVLENDVVIGSVNANLSHYQTAAICLAQADLDWLNRLVSRRVPITSFQEAFRPQEDDVKVVITLDSA